MKHRRATGAAVDLERPAEHPHALADPDDAEAPSLGGETECPVDLEAVAVVLDARLDAGASHLQLDLDGRCAAVLADIGQRLLDAAGRLRRLGLALSRIRVG